MVEGPFVHLTRSHQLIIDGTPVLSLRIVRGTSATTIINTNKFRGSFFITNSNRRLEASIQQASTTQIMSSSDSPPNTATPINYSLQAIPAAFIFSLLPHLYGTTRLMIATKNQFSRAMYVWPASNHCLSPFPSQGPSIQAFDPSNSRADQNTLIMTGHALTSKRGNPSSQPKPGIT